MGIIYYARFDNGKGYVGYTKHSLEKRIKEHLFMASCEDKGFLFHKAIRKYGQDNIEWSVLAESTDEEFLLKHEESRFILQKKTLYTENGYNLTSGGQAGSNKFWWDSLDEVAKKEHLRKVSKNFDNVDENKRLTAVRRSWNNEERRNKVREETKKRWEDENFRNRVSKSISKVRKQQWKDGIYDKSILSKATEFAAVKIRKTKWFTDGKKDYRLFPDDPMTSNLMKGRAKYGRKRKRKTD